MRCPNCQAVNDDKARTCASCAAQLKPRKPRRLYDKRGPLMKALTKEYFRYNKVKMLDGGDPVF